MKLIFRYIGRHKRIFFLSAFFLTGEAAADLLQPTFMAKIVDNGVADADTGMIISYGLTMLAIALAGALCAVMRNIFAGMTSQAVGHELRCDMYDSVMALSTENIDALRPSSVITRMTNDVTQVQDFVTSSMRMMVKAPIVCIGATLLIILQSPRQTPVIAGVLAVGALLIFLNIRIGYPRFGILQKTQDALNKVSREFLSSVRVVKAFNAEPGETEKFNTACADTARAATKAHRTAAVFVPLINLTVNFGTVLILVMAQSGDASQIGRLIASVNYMTQVAFALGMISNTLNIAARAAASSARINEVLEEKPTQRAAASPVVLSKDGSLEFRDVSFAYSGSARSALSHISFYVSPGETVGIIGATGSGKSTLVSLVLRLYDANGGQVLIDGTDVTRADSSSLHAAVAAVTQKTLLFTGTIRDNIAWGCPDAPFEAVEKASRAACADTFICASPDGYDTVLGQGGVNLSGGQKQRLTIARALIMKPKILILDDCTSALDAKIEKAVLDNIREYAKDTTVLTVSQRVSSVMRADRVLCIEDGVVCGFAPHGQLLRDCPAYREIYRSQIGGADDGCE